MTIKNIDTSGERLQSKRNRNIWRMGVTPIAAVIVFIVIYSLILPAITMSSQAAHCGLEEHTHVPECYSEQGELICGLEEHTHALACYADPDAEIENADTWQQELPELTGNRSTDVLAVAKSLIGYRESDKNYLVAEGDETKGYTRFGHWYGMMADAGLTEETDETAEENQTHKLENGIPDYSYWDWDAMFASYVLYYAGAGDMGADTDAGNWTEALAAAGLYVDAADYIPSKGDLIFFTPYADEPAMVGIVSKINKNFFGLGDRVNYISVICGDFDNEVSEIRISMDEYREGDLSSEIILGYGLLNPDIPSENPGDDISGTDRSMDSQDDLQNQVPADTHVSDEAAMAVEGDQSSSDELSLALEGDESSADRMDTEKDSAGTDESDLSNDEKPEDEEPSDPSNENPTVPDNMTCTMLPGEMRTLTANGSDYDVTLTYGAESEIPDIVKLQVKEIQAGTDDYEECLADTRDTLGIDEENADKLHGRFFDIKIMTKEGEFEPKSPVKVEISYKAPIEAAEASDFHAIHFGEDGTERIDVETSGKDDKVTAVEFAAESFSIYGVVYTVDFHCEFDGNVYEFTLPGGGFVSISELVEVLGISNLDAGTDQTQEEENAQNVVSSETNEADSVEVSERTKVFVADIADVEFSNPELVWVGKVEENITVGQLKEMNSLAVQYSRDLTEEQILAINSSSVEAGDWALISIIPFTSKETLTVTMNDGRQFVVNVTDGQIITHVITADGEDFTISVTYGPDAEIPDNAVLEAKEVLKDTDEYRSYMKQTIEIIKAQGIPDDDSNEDLEEELEKITFARYFDISILADGVKIEPKSSVEVEVSYRKSVSIPNERIQVVHFAKDKTELVDAASVFTETETNISFTQDSFSVTGTVVMPNTNITDGEYMIIYQASDNKYYALTNYGLKVEVNYNSSQNTVRYDGNGNPVWNVENLEIKSNWDDHYKFQAKNNNQYWIGLSGNNILRHYYGAVILTPASGGKYTMQGDSDGLGKYLGWHNNSFAAVDSNPISFYVVKVEPIDEIDTSEIRVDDSLHYIITDHYVGEENDIRTVTRMDDYLTSGQSIPVGSNASGEQVYAGVTVTAGHNAVSIGNDGNLTLSYDPDIHVVHIDYYYKKVREDSQVITFDENDKYDTKVIDGEKHYELTKERLHTEKTASTVDGGDGRSFNLTLEAWNVDWNIATVGMVLDASGSMAWDGAPGHYMQVNRDDKYMPYKFLSQNEVNKILCTDYSDYSPAQYGNYTYFVYENGKSVNEYAPLGYFDGKLNGNYLTKDGNINTAYAKYQNIRSGAKGWYYVNTGNANAYRDIGGSKEYNGINPSESNITNTVYTVRTHSGTKSIMFSPVWDGRNNVYRDSIKEWFVNNDTTGTYRRESGQNSYGPTQSTPSQFFVDDDGYLHCFFFHSDSVFESFVYAKQDDELIKTEMLQDAIGSFTTTLQSVAPDSAIGMTRFSRSNTTKSNGFNDNELTLLNWTTSSESIIGTLNLAYGGEYKANSSVLDPGYEGAGSLTVYNYGLTGNTSTQSGLTSFNTYLADADGNGALEKWAQDNAKPVGDGYEYDKYVIVFTDGKDTDRGTQYADLAGNAAEVLKAKGYSVITVLLTPASAIINGNLDQEFTDAKDFLDTINGPRTDDQSVTGLDWTETTYVATAADKSALTTIFRDIANRITKSLTGMTIRDYIDPRFQMVDENDNPITVGKHPELGLTLYYDAERDMQYVEWTNQTIPTNNVMDNTVVGQDGNETDVSLWSQTIRVRAKDDFLGGNEVLSNGNVEELNKVYPDGHPETTDEKTSRTFPRTTVDPQVLNLKLGLTEDTLYLGETVDADLHNALETAIGDTVDSVWYYEYLDRYGTATNTDYITQLQHGTKIEIPYYYMPDDTSKTTFDAAALNPNNPDAYMKDRIGTLTYEWVPCDANGNEINMNNPYNHLTTNTDDLHYRLKIKYTPYTVTERDGQVDGMVNADAYDRDVKDPVGTVQVAKESAKNEGIATVHVVSGKLQVRKSIKTADIKDYFTNNPDKSSVSFNFMLSRAYDSLSETYPNLTTDYKDGYTSVDDGTSYTYPAAITVTIQKDDVMNLDPDTQEYVTASSGLVEKLPIGTYTLTESADDEFKLVSYADATGSVFASESAYYAKVTGGTDSATVYMGIVHDGVPASATVKAGSPYLNAQRGAVTVTNKVNPTVMLYKADMTNTQRPIDNAGFGFYKEVDEAATGALNNVIPGKYVISVSDVTSGSYAQTTGEHAGEALAGFAYLGGLDEDSTYYLKENSVPDGYFTPEWSYIKITFSNDRVNWTLYLEDGSVYGTPESASKETVDGKNCYKVTVLNNPGVELPATGGCGINMLYLFGVTLIGLASAGFVMNRRWKDRSAA